MQPQSSQTVVVEHHELAQRAAWPATPAEATVEAAAPAEAALEATARAAVVEAEMKAVGLVLLELMY